MTNVHPVADCHTLCAQGSKREQERAEALAKGELRTWTKGAPRSHVSKGVGKGAGTQQGAKGRFEAVPDANKPRDDKLPTSVPMPSCIEDITNAGMRAMWEIDGEAPPEPLGS